MDSFYDGPRRAPPFLATGKLNGDPVVPEISILAASNAPRNAYTPYTQQTNAARQFIPSNKENFIYSPNLPQNNSILKKQVRFESPKEQGRAFKCTSEPKINENVPSFNKGGYLPSKKLDLSVIDLTSKSTPPSAKKLDRPKNYKEFLEQQESENIIEDDSVMDIFNYKRPHVSHKSPRAAPENTHREPKKNSHNQTSKVEKEPERTCNCSQKPTSEEDLSTRDLLKIIAQQSQQIAQQNAQLLLLQQQIAELVLVQKHQRESDNIGQVDQRGCGCCRRDRSTSKMKCVTSTQCEESVQREPQGKFKDNIRNFSIGMTTSFEVAFRNKPPQNQAQAEQPPAFQNQEPSVEIQEIPESDHKNQLQLAKTPVDNKGTLVDTSMVFKEPIQVREQCPSPEPSIRIDMKDFEDSDSEDSSEVEASFYRNLMTQVNKILKKAQIETTEEVVMGASNLNHKTMHKIKEATLRQLKKIGVNLPQMDDSSREHISNENEHSYDQDDISFAVKQLLMKYLPAEHLVKISSNPESMTPERVSTPKAGVISGRPEFSFASVQYMKKYNLIANSNKGFNLPAKDKQAHSPKILDITKLKQQPKLL